MKKLLVPFRKFGKFELRVQASETFDPQGYWLGGTVRAYR